MSVCCLRYRTLPACVRAGVPVNGLRLQELDSRMYCGESISSSFHCVRLIYISTRFVIISKLNNEAQRWRERVKIWSDLFIILLEAFQTTVHQIMPFYLILWQASFSNRWMCMVESNAHSGDAADKRTYKFKYSQGNLQYICLKRLAKFSAISKWTLSILWNSSWKICSTLLWISFELGWSRSLRLM